MKRMQSNRGRKGGRALVAVVLVVAFGAAGYASAVRTTSTEPPAIPGEIAIPFPMIGDRGHFVETIIGATDAPANHYRWEKMPPGSHPFLSFGLLKVERAGRTVRILPA